jgi:hypothetical protein
MRASDGESARKLAALLNACDSILTHLNEYGCSPTLSGASPFSYHAVTALRAAIEEAKR